MRRKSSSDFVKKNGGSLPYVGSQPFFLPSLINQPTAPAYWLLRNHSAESTLFVRRIFITSLGMLLCTLLLLYNFYQLQICHYQQYHTRSNDNRIKLLPLPPVRGLIYDRHGTLLAGNRTFYQLALRPDQVADVAQALQQLQPIVELTNEEINQFKKSYRCSNRFTLIPLKNRLTEQQVARFAVNQHRFPGVVINRYQRRYYPHGTALTHVIGYLAKINERDQQWLANKGQNANYSATTEIGKLGIERYYESLLHGKTGYEAVEINSRGRVIRRLSEHPPQAGRHLTLTLDVNLQCYIEKLMHGQRGAVVVMDPRDGAVLALVSSPSYDPNLFVEKMEQHTYQTLLNDPDRPLVNRATQGIYPPASTVKPFISVAALEEGVITRYSSLFDPGWWQLPGTEKRYFDWQRRGRGQVDIIKALEESSDTFFYHVAHSMGIDRLSHWMRRFGYGEYSGIDLSEECAGLMPTREWKMQHHRQPWYQGDTIPVGIGQGYWTATPIQMVKALTTLLNNGHVKMPHLLQTETPPITPIQPPKPPINPQDPLVWQLAKEGMYGVANRPNGTARRAFANTLYKAGVKSGTAQLFSLKSNTTYQPDKLAKHLHDHAQLIAFAPYQQPEIALVIIMENAGSGSRKAAPLARQIFDYLLLEPGVPKKISSPITRNITANYASSQP